MRDILHVLSTATVTKLSSYATDPLDSKSGMTFTIDFACQDDMENIMKKLKPFGKIDRNSPVDTHWFPRKIYDLDLVD